MGQGLHVYFRSSLSRRRGGVFRTGVVSPQEFPVSDCDPSRAIYPCDILVKLSYLDNNSCLVPSRGVWSGLVLDPYMVSHYQGWKPFCVLGPPFRCLHMPVSQSFFPQSEGVLPSWMRDIAPGEYWDEILDGSSQPRPQGHLSY